MAKSLLLLYGKKNQNNVFVQHFKENGPIISKTAMDALWIKNTIILMLSLLKLGVPKSLIGMWGALSSIPSFPLYHSLPNKRNNLAVLRKSDIISKIIASILRRNNIYLAYWTI